MLSKKYFTKFLAALLTATLITTFFPLDEIKVFAIAKNEYFRFHVFYKLNGTEQSIEGATVQIDCTDPIMEGKVFPENAPQTTNSGGNVKYNIKDYLDNGTDSWPNPRFDYSVSVKDSGFSSDSNAFWPNWNTGTWNETKNIELKPTEITNAVEFLNVSNTEYEQTYHTIAYDGKPHKATDLFKINGAGLTAGFDKESEYYDEDEEDYIISEVGNYTFTITFSGPGYIYTHPSFRGDISELEYKHTFTVKIEKQERDDLKFQKGDGPFEINISDNNTFTNLVSSESEPADVEYKLSEACDFASVDLTSGVVSFDSEGEVTVVATMAESETYAPTEKQYTITGKKQLVAGFENPSVSFRYTDTFPGNDLKFTIDTDYEKTYDYKIIGDDEGNIATIDPSSGYITPRGVGIVKVEVTVSADYCYDATATYDLYITSGEHKLIEYPPSFEFEYGKQYRIFEDDVSDFAYSYIDLLSYKYIYINTSENYFEVIGVPVRDPNLIYDPILSPDFWFTVSKTGDELYEDISGDFSGIIIKARQTVNIPSSKVFFTKAPDADQKDSITIAGGYPVGPCSWKPLTSQDLIEDIIYNESDNTLDVYYLRDAAKNVHEPVPVSIRFAGDGNHQEIVFETTIEIQKQSNISTDWVLDKEPDGKNGYYVSPVTFKATGEGVTFQNPFNYNMPPSGIYILSENGDYPDQEVWFYKDGESNSEVKTLVKLDQNAPSEFSVNIIDQAAKDANKSPLMVFFDTITMGLFATNDVTVVVGFKDIDSGLWKIEYSFGDDNYIPISIPTADLQKNVYVEYSFTIPADASGKLRVRAFDFAGNCVSTHDVLGKAAKTGTYFRYDGTKLSDGTYTLGDTQELMVIADKTAPKVTVAYSENDVFNDVFYNSDRTATITFDETNYFEEDVKITVIKDGTTIFDNKTDLEKNLGAVYYDRAKTIVLPFTTDGYYSLTIEYSDRSGNAADFICGKDNIKGVYTTEFVIDKTNPVVNISYDNNAVYNDVFFTAQRTATVTIKEKNFHKDDLTINIYKSLNEQSSLSEANLADYISPIVESGTNEHTFTLTFNENADYEFTISYKDRANNGCTPIYDENSKATNKFTIDLIDPVVSVKYSNNTVYNGWYFNEDRTAIITIEEHNFDKENTKFIVNGSEYVVKDNDWSHSGNTYVAKVHFTEETDYKFAITCVDKAGRSCKTIDYGESQAPVEFTIDKTDPTELSITIDGKSVVGGDSITFDTFYMDEITIYLDANCNNSGRHAFEYQLVDKSTDYSESGNWEKYDDAAGITISDSQKFILYFKATDKASNYTIIHSTGIIVDDKQPEGETYAPDIDIIPSAPNANGYYKGDVSVQINIVDPKYIGDTRDPNGYYSGLNYIKYSIYTTDSDAREEGVLLDLTSNPKIGSSDAKFDGDNLAASWTKTITIDSKQFNSNNVIVEVYAKDNAGNERITKTSAGDIMIDVTAPTIDVSYDNNEVDSENYFKADRVATVVITERNFDPKNVVTTITSSNGNTITVDGWAKTPGSGNGDNTKWTATITYNSDADYTFDIAFTDLAGNVAGPADYGNSAAPTAFTIDKTLPTVNVTYDNNDVANDMYYKSARTATVTIVEHNFNAAKVTISLQATDDGSAIEAPAVSGWTTYGDTHTATISYSNDGKYVFDIAVKDNAGNNSAEFAEQTFVVDTKAPTLTITGVVDKSANNGVVAPVITYSDTNYSADLVTINFSGANRGVLKLDGTSTDIHNGKTFVFNNFANEKSMDDIYTLEVTLTDLAGNTSTQKVQFSVNRFGSTYAMSAETKAIDGRYIQAPIDVVFTEVNPNALVDFKVTVFKNNNPVVLTKGVDYDVEEVGGEGTWREYKYIIHADNFADDGVYSVTIFSEDEAGNISENTLDTKNVDSKSSLQFGVDKTLPNIVASNLNSNTTYAVELYTVKLLVSDNLKLHSIDVYLDNSAEPYRTWDAAEIAAIVSGEYVFNIDDSSTSAHTVRIVATDEAGNVQELTVSNFYVTTNLFVRYYTNTPLFVGSIIGFILLIAIIVFIVVMSRRKRYNRR
jgi:hypothetical protein